MARLLYVIPDVSDPMSREAFTRREAALLDRYPTMFDRAAYEYGLVAIPPGWLPLLELLCDEVHNLLPPQRRRAFRWAQIKEKLGCLRAYFDGGPFHSDLLG